MRFARLDLTCLTPKQKDQIDCHRLLRSRFDPSYSNNTCSIIDFPFQNKEKSNFEILPKEETDRYVKYFAQDHPYDQLWGRPTLIHHIGRVDFDKATVYSGQDTRLLLEAAGPSPKPEIYYKYTVRGKEIEADSKHLVEQIAYQIRSERRAYREYRSQYPNEEQTGHPSQPGHPNNYSDENEEQTGHPNNYSDENEEQTGHPNHPGHPNGHLNCDSEENEEQEGRRFEYSGIHYENLFGSSDDAGTDINDSDYEDSTDSSCQVIAVKRFKTDPNVIPED